GHTSTSSTRTRATVRSTSRGATSSTNGSAAASRRARAASCARRTSRRWTSLRVGPAHLVERVAALLVHPAPSLLRIEVDRRLPCVELVAVVLDVPGLGELRP